MVVPVLLTIIVIIPSPVIIIPIVIAITITIIVISIVVIVVSGFSTVLGHVSSDSAIKAGSLEPSTLLLVIIVTVSLFVRTI